MRMKCFMPIDPITRVALEGDARASAFLNPNSPRCGHELGDDDTFCPFCGSRVYRKEGRSEVDGTLTHKLSGYSVWHLLAGIIATAVCFVVVFFCGAVYTYACKWLPIILVIIPLPIIAFFPVVAAVLITYRRFEINKFQLCLALGVLFGCIAVYGAWFWFVRCLNDGMEVWSPCRLWGCAHEISQKRVVDVGIRRLGNGIKVTGGMLLFFYYLEAFLIFIFGMSGVACTLTYCEGGFCSACARWKRMYWKDANMTLGEAIDLVRRITSNGKLEMPNGEGGARCRFRFKIRYCKKCGQGELMASQVNLVADGGDSKKEVEIPVVKELQLTSVHAAAAIDVLKSDSAMSSSFNVWKSDLGPCIKAVLTRFV